MATSAPTPISRPSSRAWPGTAATCASPWTSTPTATPVPTPTSNPSSLPSRASAVEEACPGGENRGESDLQDAVRTAVTNKRHGPDLRRQGLPAPDEGRRGAAQRDPGCVPGQERDGGVTCARSLRSDKLAQRSFDLSHPAG